MWRKSASLVLTGVLCACMTMQVTAAQTAPGSADITTEGSVNYVDTTVYSVTLPTAGCFNFIVDPQGILSATDPTAYGEDKYPGGTAGCIVATEGTGAYINNKSSVPIKLTVKAYVESDDSTGAPTTVNMLSAEQSGLVHSGIDNNMWLAFDITNDLLDLTTFVDESSIKTDVINPYVVTIDQNGQPTAGTDEALISFALYGAAYEFTGTPGNYAYSMKAGEIGDSVGMRLSGAANIYADWSAYTGTNAEKIIVKTIFNFDKLSTYYDYAALDGRAHGALADTDAQYFAGLAYDADGNPTGATVDGAIDYAVGQGSIEFLFNFGTGVKELEVTGISVNGADIDETAYRVMNGVISIKSTDAAVKAAIDTATPEGTVVPVIVTTSDGMTTTVNVTMYQ